MMYIKEVSSVTEGSERYTYHGADLQYRVAINHGKGLRPVVEIEGIKWPASSPEECTDESFSADWYKALDTGKEYLLCRGCGIDCT